MLDYPTVRLRPAVRVLVDPMPWGFRLSRLGKLFSLYIMASTSDQSQFDGDVRDCLDCFFI